MHHIPGRALLLIAAIIFVSAATASAATLKGSRASLLKQQKVARQHDFTHLRTGAQVRKFVGAGILVPIRGNANYRLKSVSYPYGRRETKTFIEDLAAGYRSACGEQLVVTSITRPTTEQPRNASPFSVHPTGMAIDLRKPTKSSCRRWLESRLLQLERQGVLDATSENRPPHYHIALYPSPYRELLAQSSPAKPKAPARNGENTWRVSRGDTLWDIARTAGVSVTAIKRMNGMKSSTIRPGQVLRIP